MNKQINPNMPNRRVLLEKYGGTGRDARSPTALACVASDVMNNRVLDAQPLIHNAREKCVLFFVLYFYFNKLLQTHTTKYV